MKKLSLIVAVCLSCVILFCGCNTFSQTADPIQEPTPRPRETQTDYSPDPDETQCVSDVDQEHEIFEEPDLENDTSQTVYITRTGKRYHSTANCPGLSNANAVYGSSLTAAKQKGLTPCARCH